MKNDFHSFSTSSLDCELINNVLALKLTTKLVDNDGLNGIAKVMPLVDHDERIRATALYLTSDGADPENMGSVPDGLEHRQPKGSHGTGPLVEQAALNALYRCTKPLIAIMHDRVQGLAIDLAAFCDVRVANESLVLCDNRVLQGQAASTGIAYLLPKLIGQSQAMRILLLGDTLSAKEAHRIHFIHQVLDDETFADEAQNIVTNISKMATRAWQVHKMQVLGQMHLDFNSAMVHSLGIRQTHVINDRVEGIKAWRERRPPNFTGT